jgi:alpha-D-ribose 1-methylphosphonate 5-triphosphate synthase subunit PhnH
MLDPVHDVQQAYRKLVTAFSFPGTVQSLLAEEKDSEITTLLPDTVLLLSMMLLDGEVTAYFHCTGDEEQSLIRHLTYVRFSDYTSADFVFFPYDRPMDREEREGVLCDVGRGTHQDPHYGATVFLYLPQLPVTIDYQRGLLSGTALRLSGPGIETETVLRVPDQDDPEYSYNILWWVGPRNRLCEEFPLGIEMVLFDAHSRVIVLPRSTEVETVTAEGAR